MDNQIPEDPYRILARERSHEDARQTVATNRMLVQSLVIINGGAATAVLAYYSARPGKKNRSRHTRSILLFKLSSALFYTLFGVMGTDSVLGCRLTGWQRTHS